MIHKSKRNKQDQVVEAAALHIDCLFDRGVNFRDRIISVSTTIEFPVFDLLDAAITEMEYGNRRPITIRLNSFGGDVLESLAIVGRMHSSKCKINVEVYGKCMSAAMLIFAAGHHRSVSKFAWGMHHASSYTASGNHTQNKALVNHVERESKMWCEWMAKFTKKDAKYWAQTGSITDKYYSPQELVKLGVADEII